MSPRRRSMSSSGPMQTARSAFCGPTTCSIAWTNSSARRPWVTITSPIMPLPCPARDRGRAAPVRRPRVGLDTTEKADREARAPIVAPTRRATCCMRMPGRRVKSVPASVAQVYRNSSRGLGPPSAGSSRGEGSGTPEGRPGRRPRRGAARPGAGRRPQGPRGRGPAGARGGRLQVHEDHDGRQRQRRPAHHVRATAFDEAVEPVGRTSEDSASRRPYDHPVVGDEAEAGVQRPQGQVALAGAGRAAEQHAAPAFGEPSGEQRRMKRRAGRVAHPCRSGSSTVKRAPATEPSGAERFSARRAPPCAAATCRAIASPSPEWPPKPLPPPAWFRGREV